MAAIVLREDEVRLEIESQLRIGIELVMNCHERCTNHFTFAVTEKEEI